MIKVENCTLIIVHFKIIPKYCTNWVLSNCRVFKLCYVFCTYVISRWLAIHLIYIEKEKKLLFFSRQLMPKSIKNNRKDGPCVKQMETILHQPNVTRQVHHGKSFIRTHVQKMLKVINYLIMYSKKTQILELLRKKNISNKSRIHYKNEINKMQDSKHQFKVILKKF